MGKRDEKIGSQRRGRCMRFDRRAPGGGAEVTCRLENSKAFLQWTFYFTGAESTSTGTDNVSARAERTFPFVRLCLLDTEGNMVLECLHTLKEEEPLEAVLLQPHLWRSVRDPYLYRMEAILMDGNGRCLDRLCGRLALRNIESRNLCGVPELLLNGEVFPLQAVRYSLPRMGSGAERQRLMMEDLRQLMRLGANCICLLGQEEQSMLFRQFCWMCDRIGILVFLRAEKTAGTWACSWNRESRVFLEKEIPFCHRTAEAAAGAKEKHQRGTEQSSLFLPHSQCPTSLYYEYKAKWSQEPFVYLVPESVKRLESGNYVVGCYSNCSRVALYSDGTLFEFQKGQGPFVFREVPARHPCIMLAAEGEGCSASLSIPKMNL